MHQQFLRYHNKRMMLQRTHHAQVCYMRLSSMPHVEAFVKKKAKGFQGLRVVDQWGAPPRIVLSDGKSQESVRVDGWKTEQIEEFLRNKLVVVGDE